MAQITVSARTTAPTGVAWSVFADARTWSTWAPHIRDTTGAGTVIEGDELTIDSIVPGLGVEARITRVEAPWRWDFELEPLPGLRLVGEHHVRDVGTEREVVSVLRTAGRSSLAGRMVLTAYRPLAALAMRRLARLIDVRSAVALRG